jgi:hypothetical protein
MVFGANVTHAHDSAKLWNDYKPDIAFAIDGKTEKMERERELTKFKSYRRQVISNYNVLTEGTNLPNCSSIVLLRPSKSEGVIVQAVGRGLRPLPGTIDHLTDATADERRAAIAASAKPYCTVFDAVDKMSEGVYRVQQMVGLPVNLKVSGVMFLDAKKKVDEFVARTGRDIGECPLTYEEIDIVLGRHDALHNNKLVINREDWEPNVNGYRFTKTRPGYSAELLCGDNGKRLVVKYGGKEILNRGEKPEAAGVDLSTFLNKAADHVTKTMANHATENPRDRGTTKRLTEKQVNFLLKHCRPKVTREIIDTWAYAKATGTIKMIFDRWDRGKGAAQ